MPCQVREVNGHTMIICSRGGKIALCINCGEPAPFLCDYEVAPGKTCDATLCGRCRINMGLKDYCPNHAGKVGRLDGF